MSKTDGDLWEERQRSIPFLKGTPDKFKVHDALLECPFCGGEMFGRCLCCQQYFCHDCEDGRCVSEEEIIEQIEVKQKEERN